MNFYGFANSGLDLDVITGLMEKRIKLFDDAGMDLGEEGTRDLLVTSPDKDLEEKARVLKQFTISLKAPLLSACADADNKIIKKTIPVLLSGGYDLDIMTSEMFGYFLSGKYTDFLKDYALKKYGVDLFGNSAEIRVDSPETLMALKARIEERLAFISDYRTEISDEDAAGILLSEQDPRDILKVLKESGVAFKAGFFKYTADELEYYINFLEKEKKHKGAEITPELFDKLASGRMLMEERSLAVSAIASHGFGAGDLSEKADARHKALEEKEKNAEGLNGEENFYLDVPRNTALFLAGRKEITEQLSVKLKKLEEAQGKAGGIRKIFRVLSPGGSVEKVRNELEASRPRIKEIFDRLFLEAGRSLVARGMDLFNKDAFYKALARIWISGKNGHLRIERLNLEIVHEPRGAEISKAEKILQAGKTGERLEKLFSAENEENLTRELGVFFGWDPMPGATEHGSFLRDFMFLTVFKETAARAFYERLSASGKDQFNEKLSLLCEKAEKCLVDIAVLDLKTAWLASSPAHRAGLKAAEKALEDKARELTEIEKDILKLIDSFDEFDFKTPGLRGVKSLEKTRKIITPSIFTLLIVLFLSLSGLACQRDIPREQNKGAAPFAAPRDSGSPDIGASDVRGASAAGEVKEEESALDDILFKFTMKCYKIDNALEKHKSGEAADKVRLAVKKHVKENRWSIISLFLSLIGMILSVLMAIWASFKMLPSRRAAASARKAAFRGKTADEIQAGLDILARNGWIEEKGIKKVLARKRQVEVLEKLRALDTPGLAFSVYFEAFKWLKANDISGIDHIGLALKVASAALLEAEEVLKRPEADIHELLSARSKFEIFGPSLDHDYLTKMFQLDERIKLAQDILRAEAVMREAGSTSDSMFEALIFLENKGARGVDFLAFRKKASEKALSEAAAVFNDKSSGGGEREAALAKLKKFNADNEVVKRAEKIVSSGRIIKEARRLIKAALDDRDYLKKGDRSRQIEDAIRKLNVYKNDEMFSVTEEEIKKALELNMVLSARADIRESADHNDIMKAIEVLKNFLGLRTDLFITSKEIKEALAKARKTRIPAIMESIASGDVSDDTLEILIMLKNDNADPGTLRRMAIGYSMNLKKTKEKRPEKFEKILSVLEYAGGSWLEKSRLKLKVRVLRASKGKKNPVDALGSFSAFLLFGSFAVLAPYIALTIGSDPARAAYYSGFFFMTAGIYLAQFLDIRIGVFTWFRAIFSKIAPLRAGPSLISQFQKARDSEGRALADVDTDGNLSVRKPDMSERPAPAQYLYYSHEIFHILGLRGTYSDLPVYLLHGNIMTLIFGALIEHIIPALIVYGVNALIVFVLIAVLFHLYKPGFPPDPGYVGRRGAYSRKEAVDRINSLLADYRENYRAYFLEKVFMGGNIEKRVQYLSRCREILENAAGISRGAEHARISMALSRTRAVLKDERGLYVKRLIESARSSSDERDMTLKLDKARDALYGEKDKEPVLEASWSDKLSKEIMETEIFFYTGKTGRLVNLAGEEIENSSYENFKIAGIARLLKDAERSN
ncbi:MAG: hypothetical protein ABH883_09050, partial [Candidatus Omnitrophota bacterium]